MTHSFYNGVSGVKTHQFGMDVWSNNISNINNVGFRAKRPEFSNVFSQAMANSLSIPATSGIGMGSSGQTTALLEKMGGYTDGDNPFDMAIAGEGWFGTQGEDGDIYYTRRGDFSLNANGDLVAKNGNFLLGTMTNVTSNTIKQNDGISLGDVKSQKAIKLPKTLSIPASPTTKVNIKANLNPKLINDFVDVDLAEKNIKYQIDEATSTISINGDVKDVALLQNPKPGDKVMVEIKDEIGHIKLVGADLKDDLTWSIDGANLGSLDATKILHVKAKVRSIQEVVNKESLNTNLYSSSGENNLKIDFTKEVPSKGVGTSWNAVAVVSDENGKEISKKEGNLKFDEFGGLLFNGLKTVDNGGSEVELNLGSIYNKSVPNSGFDGITSMRSGSYGAGDIRKDGYKAGELTDYSMDDYGQIEANFDNGISIPVAKVAVYHFQNDQGLVSEGVDYFRQSVNSGKPIFYKDKNGVFTNGTSIKAHKLETSNVSFGVALTEVIVMQKAYDASARSITTSDQLIQNAINMKR